MCVSLSAEGVVGLIRTRLLVTREDRRTAWDPPDVGTRGVGRSSWREGRRPGGEREKQGA